MKKNKKGFLSLDLTISVMMFSIAILVFSISVINMRKGFIEAERIRKTDEILRHKIFNEINDVNNGRSSMDDGIENDSDRTIYRYYNIIEPDYGLVKVTIIVKNGNIERKITGYGVYESEK